MSFVGRGSAVGIETRYDLFGDRTPVDVEFSAFVQTDKRGHLASCKMGTGFVMGVKRRKLGFNHLHLSSAEVKERVEVYLSCLSWPSWPILNLNFTLYMAFT